MIANVNVLCRKFECRKDIHYKTRTSYEKYNSEVYIYIYIFIHSNMLLEQSMFTRGGSRVKSDGSKIESGA